MDTITCTVLAEDALRWNDGGLSDVSVRQVREALEAARDAITPPTIYRPWDQKTWTVDLKFSETWIHYDGINEPVLAYNLVMQELPTLVNFNQQAHGAAHTHTTEYFDATHWDGAVTTLTLTYTPLFEPMVVLFPNGGTATVQYLGTDYTRSGGAITFVTPPGTDDVVEVEYAY